MDVNTTSFLIICDTALNIINTFWYYPAYLISPFQKSLKDIFIANDLDKIILFLSSVLNHQDSLKCSGPFTIINPPVKVSLCALALNDKVIIHGIDSAVFENNDCTPLLKDTMYRFMRIMKASDNDFVDENNDIIRKQFEKIQKLNNDLLNTQRQLKKVNIRLNQLNEELNNRLVKDALTGLISRYQYREEIRLTIEKAPNKLGIFTFIDIDDFKKINDTYGHGAGDLFLKEFANRLKKLSFDNQVCIRIAGDEFGLYIHGYDNVNENDIKAIWINFEEKVLHSPVRLNKIQEKINCSLGMAIYGHDTIDVYELIEYADFAMYEAKQTGKNTYKQFNRERYNNKHSHNK